MNFHETSIGETSEWYTPPEIFEALGLQFDLDPCSHDICAPNIPATQYFTKEDDGLSRKWGGGSCS